MATSKMQRGDATIAALGTTVNVTFGVAFRAATTPDVSIANNPRNVSYSITSVTNTGFTLTIGVAAGTASETWRYTAWGTE